MSQLPGQCQAGAMPSNSLDTGVMPSNLVTIKLDKFNTIKRNMRRWSYEEFGLKLTDYHNYGHNIIAEECVSIRGTYGLMYHTTTSARDSIFWRWHTHLEDIVQEYRDTNFPR